MRDCAPPSPRHGGSVSPVHLAPCRGLRGRAGPSVRPPPGPSGRHSDSIAHPVPRPHSDEPGADPVLVPGAVPVFPLASFDLLIMQIGVIQTPTVPDPTPLPCARAVPSTCLPCGNMNAQVVVPFYPRTAPKMVPIPTPPWHNRRNFGPI